MTPLERLLADLRAPEPLVELENADLRLEEAATAAISGNYARAAEIAEALYSERIFDARLLGHLMFHELSERGPAALEPVLRTAFRVISEGRAAFTPVTRRDVLLDGAITSVLEKLVRQLERAEKSKGKDPSWQMWLAAAKNATLAGARPAAEALLAALGTAIPRARGAIPLLHLIDLLSQLTRSAEPRSQRSADLRLNGSFSSATTLDAGLQEDGAPAGGAEREPNGNKPSAVEPWQDAAEPGTPFASPPEAARAGSPSAEAAPTQRDHATPASSKSPSPQAPAQRVPPPDERSETNTEPDAAGAMVPPAHRPRARYARAPRPLPAGFVSESAIAASRPLRQLARSIQLFTKLTEQEEFIAAAVVADDVRCAIDKFDPRRYLPAVLAPYFSALARFSEELEPILKQQDSLTFSALQQLYRVAPKTFRRDVSSAAHPTRNREDDSWEAHGGSEDEEA